MGSVYNKDTYKFINFSYGSYFKIKFQITSIYKITYGIIVFICQKKTKAFYKKKQSSEIK